MIVIILADFMFTIAEGSAVLIMQCSPNHAFERQVDYFLNFYFGDFFLIYFLIEG